MAEKLNTYLNTPEAAASVGWTHPSVHPHVHGDPKSKYVKHDHLNGKFHYTDQPGNLVDHKTFKAIKEDVVNEVEDDTKKYLEPKAETDKATWMKHKIQKYTQAGIPDHQFDGGTKSMEGRNRLADPKDTRTDNENERVLGMVELPHYLGAVKDAIQGMKNAVVKEDFEYPEFIEESNVYKAMAAANKARIKSERDAQKASAKEHAKNQAAEHKSRAKHAETAHAHLIAHSVADHFPDSDGYEHVRHQLQYKHGIPEHKVDDHMNKIVRKHLGAKDYGNYVDKAHKNYHADTNHVYDMGHSNYGKHNEDVEYDLNERAHVIIDGQSGKVVGRAKNRTEANTRALKLDIAAGKDNRHRIQVAEEELMEAFPPPKKDGKKKKPKPGAEDDSLNSKGGGDEEEAEDEAEEEDDDDIENAEDDVGDGEGGPGPGEGVTTGLGGSEVKTSLETLALQAAELFAEVDEKQAFDAEIKDALEAAVEALGKVHAAIMGGTAEADEDDDGNSNKPNFKEGGDDDSKVQREETIVEISKDLAKRYIDRAHHQIDGHRWDRNKTKARIKNGVLPASFQKHADWNNSEISKRKAGIKSANKRLK